MRWIFLLLLILNIAYIGWGLTRSPEQSQPVAESRRDVPTIVLLSELEQKAQQTQAAEDSEQQGGEGQAATAESRTEPLPRGFACYTLGPFRELAVLSKFTRAIKEYVVEASFRSREENEQSIFQVYLKPRDGKKAASATRKQLSANNFNDHYIITSGPNKNGVSLGHFSEMDRAFKLASQVEKLGFNPVVEPIFKATTIYWLDYRVRADQGIPESVFEQHLEPDISSFDRPCV